LAFCHTVLVMAGLPHDGTASGDPVPSTSMSAPPLHVVHLGLLTTQVINALYNVLMQYLVSPAVSITPLVFCAYRDVLAWPLLLTACTWTLPRWSSSSSAALSKPYVPSLLLPADKREWPQLALQALLGVFCNQLFFLYGVQLTDATTAAIVNLSLPIFTASLAVCMGVEVPRWRTAAGIALAVAGAAVLKLGAGSSSSPASSSSRSLALNTAGITVLLLGALASAVYLLLQASMLKRHPALLVTTWEVRHALLSCVRTANIDSNNTTPHNTTRCSTSSAQRS